MTGNLFLFSNDAAKNVAVENKSAEARLIERVRAGGDEAFDEFYKRFAPMVHGIVLARVPFDDAADIAQEVFLLAYQNLHTLRNENALGAWLATIARNRATEFYRQRKPTEELTEDFRSKTDTNVEAKEILEAIRRLPDAYRETLILRLVEGMSGQEIAEQTGLKPESVRVNLHRGMKLLRERLGIAP